MYRLLIVDDEPAIVDGLLQHFQGIFDWELDVCKAYSAVEALEIAKKTKIDILISDIRMPGKSGLQLVDDVLFYWSSCRVIMLTGHSEFDYAYKAIQKKVDSYILKMDGIEVIHQAVSAAISKLDEESRNRKVLERASLNLTAAEPLLKKEYFEALLAGDNAAHAGNSEGDEGLTLQIKRGKPLMMIAGKVDQWEEKVPYMKKMELYYSIQRLFAEHLPVQIKAETVIYDRSELVWFVQPADEPNKFNETDGGTDWQALIFYLKGMLEPVQNSCRNALGIPISFIVGQGAVEWEEIGRSFDLIRAAFKQRALFGPAMAIIDLDKSEEWFKGDARKSVETSAAEFNKMLIELGKSLDEGKDERAMALTAEVVGALKKEMKSHYLIGMERYYMVLLAYMSVLNAMETNDKSLRDIRVASLSMMDTVMDWETIEEQLIALCRSICQIKREKVERSEHLMVERIHRFVGENLGNDLSLARIAEVVYFNPSYLSRFYKQLTGRNLSDYINEAKAEAAMNMLTDTKLKVNEVALRLGFESPSYFTSFFRKMTGSTPQEYRENFILKGK